MRILLVQSSAAHRGHKLTPDFSSSAMMLRGDLVSVISGMFYMWLKTVLHVNRLIIQLIALFLLICQKDAQP